MRKDSPLDKSLIFLIFLTLVFAILVLFIVINIRVDEFTEAMKSRHNIASAVIISDEGRPIVTEIFFYDNQTGRGALYNIPENMGTLIESLDKMDRLDTLFDSTNPEGYVDKISALLGVDIDFYVHWEMDKLIKTVDLLEGVELFIPNPVWQVSESECNLLPSGRVNLDGEKVKSYLSYRLVTDTDSDMVTRKHDFTKGFIQKLGQKSDLFLSQEWGESLYSLAQTNLDMQAFQSYIKIFETIDTDRLVLQKVLGKNRVVDNQNLLFPYYDEKLMREMTRQIVDTLANMDIYSDEDIVVSVEIQNGTDISGLASRTAQLYQSYGYKINSYKNADNNEYENTIVIDRRGNSNAAKRVANLIRCDLIRQLSGNTHDDTVDIILILGKDFDGRYVKK